MDIIKKYKNIILYGVFGIIGTAVNVALFVFLSEKCALHYMVSNIIAWIFSVAFAFVTNKIWVFDSKRWIFPLWLKECLSFFLARVATCVFDVGYMFVAVSLLGQDKTISKVIANVIVIIANYIFSKFFIFKHQDTVSQ